MRNTRFDQPHSEVDLLSEPITVIELEDSVTLKNGENVMDEKSMGRFELGQSFQHEKSL